MISLLPCGERSDVVQLDYEESTSFAVPVERSEETDLLMIGPVFKLLLIILQRGGVCIDQEGVEELEQ